MPRRVSLVLLVALAIAFTQSPVTGETTLEARIQEVTGIPRTVYAELQSRAAVRAVQIQTDFSHSGLSYGEGEIIARNSGFEDPLGTMILGWLASPSHRDMMYDSSYVQIGCATSYLAPRTYGVCLFVVAEPVDAGTAQPPAPVQPGSTPASVPVLPGSIPDTAMR